MRSHRKRRIALGVLALVILFALFEVAVRAIPPDQAQIVDTHDTAEWSPAARSRTPIASRISAPWWTRILSGGQPADAL